MKLFKKLMVMAASLTMVFAMSVTAFAATKSDIVAELKKAGVPDEYITTAETFLANNEVTTAEADQVVALIKEAAVTKGSATKVSDLTAEQKKAIFKNVEDAAKVVGATVTVDTKNNTVKVTDKNSKEYVVTETKEVIKPTGMSVMATYGVMAVLAMALVGCGVFVSKRKAA